MERGGGGGETERLREKEKHLLMGNISCQLS